MLLFQEGQSNSKKSEGKNKRNETSEGTHKHTKKKSSASHEAVMNAKRKKLWVAVGKKEIGRVSLKSFLISFPLSF